MADKAHRKYDIGPPNLRPLDRSAVQKSYFFLEGKLYKTLRQDRPRDILTAWDFEGDRIADFVLSDAKKKMKNAYDTVEVAQLLNRHRARIQGYVSRGDINSPIRIHHKGMNSKGTPFSRMKWSEDDILALHEFMLTNGSGRPRKDGTMYAGARLPTRKELLALLRQQTMFYMRTESGDYIPVWSANNEV